jgi:hypothetical protein
LQLLLLSLFGYRLAERGHAPQHAPQPLPPLVPPPPLPPPLPEASPALAHAPGVCRVCGMVPHEPTASPSGYVLCARCVVPAVEKHGRCPLAQTPATPPELLRLYETSRPTQNP